MRVTKNSENKPRGLYFSMVLFGDLFLKGFIFRGVYIRRGLSREWNLSFQIDRINLIVGGKFTVFALFNFVFYKLPGGLYLEGWLNSGFLVLPLWGADIWRGLFYGIFRNACWECCVEDIIEPWLCRRNKTFWPWFGLVIRAGLVSNNKVYQTKHKPMKTVTAFWYFCQKFTGF